MFTRVRKAATALLAALVLPFSLAFPPTALAQPQVISGALPAALGPAAPGDVQATLFSMTGRVADGSGNGVPGMTVTATTTISETGSGEGQFHLYLPTLQRGQPPGAGAAGAGMPAATAIGSATPVTFTTATGADGNFAFTDLPAGVYTVVAAKAGYSLQPASLAVTLPGGGTNVNFTATLLPTPTLYSRLALGDRHTCALTTTGGVKCWGNNDSGQLGDGTTTDRLAPTGVSGLAGGVQAITAGGQHSCALTAAGGVKCWGSSTSGQLGDGTTTNHPTPADVTGLTSGVKAVAAGYHHTCALTTAGGVKCWGSNTSGQLGDGTTTDRSIPVDVSGLTGGVQAIAAGNSHTCALTTAGGVKCWGDNDFGQLGDGTTTDRLTPVDVSSLTGGVQAIAAGGAHTCALTTASGVKCWGANFSGQLGDGTASDRLTPVDVSGLAGGVQTIAAGDYHTCALTTAGVKCWGANFTGQLGDGTTASHLTPTGVSGLGGVQAVAAGGLHNCALSTAGSLKCWGYNDSGQLGDGTRAYRLTPAEVSSLASGVQAITAGRSHTCALTTAGGVKCWGNNSDGQLGDGAQVSRWTLADVSSLTSGVQAIAAGNSHTCALTTAGGAKCWGINYTGQLGDGTTSSHLTPADVTGLTSGVQAVVAGYYHTCALTAAGGVKCWGSNINGQLGDGTMTLRPTPTDVSGLTSGVKAIAASDAHTCALTAAGGVKCWGSNSSGQLGDGTTTDHATPVDVSGLGGGVQAIAAGGAHTCALTAAGGVKCWGNNSTGQLGDGTTSDHFTPTDVSSLTSGVKAIAANYAYTCALTTAGGVKCWGENSYGQPGDGTTIGRLAPTDVSGLAGGVQTIAAGSQHTCALTTAGGVKCWGANYAGQAGVNPGWLPVDVLPGS